MSLAEGDRKDDVRRGRPVPHFSVFEIERAIKHHRRALEALRDGITFDGILYPTEERLLEHLQQDLTHLEKELEQRGAGLPSPYDERPSLSSEHDALEL